MTQNAARTRCDGVSRRDCLTIGGLSALGLGLAPWFALRAGAAEVASRRANHCILIWLDGGPSHLETFDPKPNAPQEVRGPSRPISTSVPGIGISEWMPHLAARMDRVALVRSMTSPLGEHNFGTHYLMTGYKPTPVLEYASFGSVTAHLREKTGDLPGNVAVPEFRVGGARFSGNGFLPASAQPFDVGGDPARPDFEVRDLNLPPDLGLERLRRRRRFVEMLDGNTATGAADAIVADAHFEQAYRLITSTEARLAFDLSQESPQTRQRYGSRTIGQSCLMARRLIERGVHFVTVVNPGWDTHAELITRLRDGYVGAANPVGLIPSLDMALSGLLDDLSDRGLLDETLVVVMGEFGRTPKLNTAGGRDHWPRVFSVALAGGGIQGGQVFGSSDAVGESPASDPVTPADLLATVYTLLGIAPDTKLPTADGRLIRVVPEESHVLHALIS